MADAFNRNSNDAAAALQARTKQQNRANVMQLKLIGQSHPTGLTNNLLKLFEPRAPLEFKPPPEKRKCPQYTGMAQFVSNFAEPGDPEYAPAVQEGETSVQKRARIHKLRLEEGARKAAEELEKYDPNNDPNISGDPYKTLFVARLNYETTESRIKREFEAYGSIKRVGIIEHPKGAQVIAFRFGKRFNYMVRLITHIATNKPRGYAFVEYLHTREMKAAYKQADGKKLDNRRVLVDVERGRTVPNWRPRRLGGGLGTTRVGGEEVNQKNTGREQQQSGAPPRSEEPRIRDDRHGDRDREKSRERGRDKEREVERSRERSHDRPRDREHREDRHHRDRDKNRDKDKERDRGRDRDRTRDRDRGRDRDRDRERERDRPRERERDKDKDRERDDEVVDRDRDRGRSRDKEYESERVGSKHGRELNYHAEPEDDREGDRDRENYDYYEERRHQGRGKYDNEVDKGDHDDHAYDYPDRDHNRYDKMEDNHRYDPAASEANGKERTQDLDREYRRSDRSLSREQEY